MTKDQGFGMIWKTKVGDRGISVLFCEIWLLSPSGPGLSCLAWLVHAEKAEYPRCNHPDLHIDLVAFLHPASPYRDILLVSGTWSCRSGLAASLDFRLGRCSIPGTMRAGDWGTREWKECVKDSRLNSLLWGASRGLTCATFLTPPHFDSLTRQESAPPPHGCVRAHISPHLGLGFLEKSLRSWTGLYQRWWLWGLTTTMVPLPDPGTALRETIKS